MRAISLIFGLAGVAAWVGSAPVALGQTYDLEKVESRIHQFINRERDAKGAGPLVIDGRLTILARAHTDDMVKRGFYGHENPDGLTAPDRLEREHPELVVLTVAENINLIEPVDPDHISSDELAERLVQPGSGPPATAAIFSPRKLPTPA